MAHDRPWPLPSAAVPRSRAPAVQDAGPSPAAQPGGSLAAPAPQRRWRSSELFGGAHEVEIEHGDAVYRLRLTALGKLIMTK